MQRQYCSGYPITEAPSKENKPDLSLLIAFNQQLRLGITNLLRGMILRKIVSLQQSYISTYRVKTNNVVSWGRNLIKSLHQFNTSIWNYRCDVAHKASRTIMEKHTRHQARKLLQYLQRDPHNKLPYEKRSLLHKPLSFFSTTTLQNIQSWVYRANLVLDMQSEKMKVGVSDIQDWLS